MVNVYDYMTGGSISPTKHFRISTSPQTAEYCPVVHHIASTTVQTKLATRVLDFEYFFNLLHTMKDLYILLYQVQVDILELYFACSKFCGLAYRQLFRGTVHVIGCMCWNPFTLRSSWAYKLININKSWIIERIPRLSLSFDPEDRWTACNKVG